MAFVWGDGGAQLSPAAIAERRKVAQAMMMQGGDVSPIQSPWQGAARVAQAMLGGFDAYKADEAEKANVTAERQLLNELMMPAAPAAAAMAPAGTNPVTAARPMGRLPGMSSRVYDQTEFNPLDAAVATPTELAAGVTAPAKYASLIGKAAVDNDLPPQLLAAQIKQESGFNPNAVSPVGAAGISQFMPGTARDMGVSDPFSPEQAIPAGARYLRQNIDKFGGSVPLGLAAYNAGPGRVERSGGDISRLPAETRGYVANITGAALPPDNAGRPILNNPDGTFSTERTITVGIDGKFYNIPTIIGGRQVGEDAAIAAFRAGSNPAVGEFSSQAEAVRSAEARSNQIGVARSGEVSSASRGAQQVAQAVNPKLIAAMSSPYVSEGTKKILGAMLERQMTVDKPTTIDLGNEIGVMRNGQVVERIAKTRDPMEAEAKRLDIETKRKGLEAAPTVQRIKQPDGSEVAVQWDPQSKAFVPLKAPEGGNPVATPKLTEVQAKDVGFYNRGQKLIPRLEEQDEALTSRFSSLGGTVPLAGNYLKSDEYRQAEQTGRELLAVILRKDTGAAVTDGEMSLYGSIYLPQPGDDKTTIGQKRAARQTAIEGIRMGLGPAEIIFKSRETAEAAKKAKDAPSGVPAGVDAKIWQHMTPEERALWKK